MAHHMLYTAMREYDCYDGYLWAPFDTLLNIPRLQQFDQNNFWYHSPFGQYVPNAAWGDEVTNQNASRHPPPLNISPDPSLNLTEGWRGWGPDWWYVNMKYPSSFVFTVTVAFVGGGKCHCSDPHSQRHSNYLQRTARRRRGLYASFPQSTRRNARTSSTKDQWNSTSRRIG